MAGIRLEYWSTLNREELKRRVEEELRRGKLTFVEQQLLEAAQGRLRTWREPHKRSSHMSDDDEPKTDPAPSKEPDPAKESKVKRDTSKVRSGKKRDRCENHQDGQGCHRAQEERGQCRRSYRISTRTPK